MSIKIKPQNYQDVREFNEKFGLLIGAHPQQLTKQKLKERLEFLFEEFTEFVTGCGFCIAIEKRDGRLADSDYMVTFDEIGDQDISEQADALIDLVYVAMGTAVMMGLPWQQLWDDVHRANMGKVRGISHRGHAYDCIKPQGWVGPKTMEILLESGYDPEAEEVGDVI